MNNDLDGAYLINGVEFGFDILEGKNPFFSSHMQNYKSSTIENKSKVEKQINKELTLGNYEIVHKKTQV